jgi:capsid protein
MNTVVPKPGALPPLQMNVVEKGLSLISPAAALSRFKSRVELIQFGYDAAYPGLARGYSGGLAKNAPSETIRAQTDRVKLMNDARDMERQFGLLIGILERVQQYVCGRINYQPITGDREVDKQYREYFAEWCWTADYTNRFPFSEMVGLALRGMLRDGNYGFIKRYVDGGLKLEYVEGDRIGNPNAIGDPNERYISGVGIDAMGKPEFYRIFQRTRTAVYQNPEDVPASRFLHLYKPIRADQYLGFSWLAAALPLIRDLYEIFRCERDAAKWASGIAGKKTTPDPAYGKGVLGWDGQTPLGYGTDTLQPGKIVNVTPGFDIEVFDAPNRPSGAFMAHVQAIIREIAISLNFPYGFIYDMSQFGSASARLETAQAQRSIESMQRLLEARALREIKNDVLANGIARGLIPPHENWRKGQFNYGAFITADYGYQVTADLQLAAAGFKTGHEIAHENGREFDEVVDTVVSEKAEWYQASVNHQIPLELCNQQFAGATPLLAQMNEPPPPKGPPPTLLQTIGDKGGMLILDTMEKVGMGVIPHEDGVQFLVTLLGLPRETVETMIPPTTKKPEPVPAQNINPQNKPKPKQMGEKK